MIRYSNEETKKAQIANNIFIITMLRKRKQGKGILIWDFPALAIALCVTDNRKKYQKWLHTTCRQELCSSCGEPQSRGNIFEF